MFSPSISRTAVWVNRVTGMSRKEGSCEPRRASGGQRKRTFALHHNQSTSCGNNAVQSRKGGSQLLREPRE